MINYRIPVFWIVFILMLPACSVMISGQKINFKETPEGVWLMEGENPRFFYRTATKSVNGQYPRANYIHPLYGLEGDTLTEDFPEDHPHQRGIFWAWHQLYAGNERLADPWLCEGIEWKVENIETTARNNVGTLKSSVFWTIKNKNSRYDQKAVMREDVVVKYKKLPLYFELEFSISLTPLIDSLRLGGSEDIKGYGGFSTRLKMPPMPKFICHTGEIIPENTPVDAGGWVQITGNLSDEENKRFIVVLMCEPEKLPSFKGWILRKSNSMQNAAFPGKEPILMKKGKPLVFKNKIIVLDKYLQIKDINLMYERFIK